MKNGVMIMKKHTVRINIGNRNGNKQHILTSTKINLPYRLMRFLFGDFC